MGHIHTLSLSPSSLCDEILGTNERKSNLWKKKGKINCRAASDKQKIKIKMASGDAFAAKVPRHLNQKDASLLFGNGVASRKGGSRHTTVFFTKPFGDLVEERTGWASTLCHYGILVTPPNSSNKQKKKHKRALIFVRGFSSQRRFCHCEFFVSPSRHLQPPPSFFPVNFILG